MEIPLNKFTLAVRNSDEIYELRHFELLHILPYKEFEMIMQALVIDQSSTIGYSPDSYVDQAMFKFDVDGSVMWATVVDVDNSYDSSSKYLIDGSTIYSSFISNCETSCFYTLSADDGKFIASS